jgi:hypothetical protein
MSMIAIPFRGERGHAHGGRREVLFFSSIGKQSQSVRLVTSGEEFPETMLPFSSCFAWRALTERNVIQIDRLGHAAR